MSDVLLYLVRLADRCGVDLPAAALAKMKKNAAKYPADRARGRSDKYTAYVDGATGAAAGVAPVAAAAGQGAPVSDSDRGHRRYLLGISIATVAAYAVMAALARRR
jgi:hypothetical protein